MTQNHWRFLLATIAIVLASTIIFWQLATTQAQAGSCTTGVYLESTFASAAGWDLCWSTRPHEGVVLSEIYYSTPAGLRRKVLQEASLAQIEVRYDDGLATFTYGSEAGLGEAQLLSLSTADCPNGTLLSQNEQSLLCQQTAGRGYLYKYYAQQRQGDALTLFSVSQIGQQLYIVQWRFLDDGTIEPMVGDGGRLLRSGSDLQYGLPVNAEGDLGIGYLTNYWWRLDFDLGGNGANDNVDEFEVSPINANTQHVSTASALSTESGRTTNLDKKRSWRVRDGDLTNDDGHAISYQLDPIAAGYRDVGSAVQPWNQHDFYVTRANDCEKLPLHNPTTGGCADNVAGFVNGESIVNADIVFWLRVTAHRLPRPEDTPLLDVQWQGFHLLPRDWTAQSPFNP